MVEEVWIEEHEMIINRAMFKELVDFKRKHEKSDNDANIKSLIAWCSGRFAYPELSWKKHKHEIEEQGLKYYRNLLNKD